MKSTLEYPDMKSLDDLSWAPLQDEVPCWYGPSDAETGGPITAEEPQGSSGLLARLRSFAAVLVNAFLTISTPACPGCGGVNTVMLEAPAPGSCRLWMVPTIYRCAACNHRWLGRDFADHYGWD